MKYGKPKRLVVGFVGEQSEVPRASLFVIESARGPIIVVARAPAKARAVRPYSRPLSHVNHVRYSPLPHNTKLTGKDFAASEQLSSLYFSFIFIT